MTAIAGDRSEIWRSTYRRVRKDPLRGTSATNRRRLSILGANDLRADRWLDVGAGDGNLSEELVSLGASEVVAVELQIELLQVCDPSALRIAGSAVGLPIAGHSVDVVVVMDVLHHLEGGQVEDAVCEIARVLRPGGRLLVCEPAATRTRGLLTVLLMGRLGGLSKFSRDKREMVRAERPTLDQWLLLEPDFASMALKAGFVAEFERRHLMHSYWRFTGPQA